MFRSPFVILNASNFFNGVCYSCEEGLLRVNDMEIITYLYCVSNEQCQTIYNGKI